MIKVNITKAKVIANDIRRAARAKAFAPLDVEATVPHLAANAEAKRAIIRGDDAVLQVMIDATDDPVILADLVRDLVES